MAVTRRSDLGPESTLIEVRGCQNHLRRDWNSAFRAHWAALYCEAVILPLKLTRLLLNLGHQTNPCSFDSWERSPDWNR